MLLASWICTFTMCSIGLTAPIEVDNKTPADFKENRVGQCWVLWKIPPLVVTLFLADLVKSCGMELNTQEWVKRRKLKDQTFWKWKSINDLSLDLGLRVEAVLLLCEVTNCCLEAWEVLHNSHWLPSMIFSWRPLVEVKIWMTEIVGPWSSVKATHAHGLEGNWFLKFCSVPTRDSSTSRRRTGHLYHHQDKGKTQGIPWVINSANSQITSLFGPILNDPFLHSSPAVCSSGKRCCKVLQLFSFFSD